MPRNFGPFKRRQATVPIITEVDWDQNNEITDTLYFCSTDCRGIYRFQEPLNYLRYHYLDGEEPISRVRPGEHCAHCGKPLP